MSRYGTDGRVVLITGGARGIGLDAAQRLVEQGAYVALVDREADEVELRAKELGDRAAAYVADVTDLAAVQAAVDAAVDRFGGLDVVVANAGISGRPQPVLTMDPAEFRRVIDINVMGVYNAVHAALPHVVARKGYVLSIASIAALIPGPFLAPYTASKHAVDGFARSLRLELEHTGTKVGVGYFSFIDTPMVRAAVADPLGGAAISILPAPFNRPIPVSHAGKAVVRGIERRARWVYAPFWVPNLIRLRGLGGPLESVAGRLPQLGKLLTEAENAASARTEGDPK